MIIDKTENWALYRFGPAWEKAFAFLSTLNVDTAEGKYSIEGEDIFAIVMSYDTRTPETAILESHREYVDIQTVLSDAERFECSFRDALEVETPYDASLDAEFYKRNAPGEVRVDVTPGTFVMLYPHDAHMAGLIVGASVQRVKKVVVKVRRSLLQ